MPAASKRGLDEEEAAGNRGLKPEVLLQNSYFIQISQQYISKFKIFGRGDPLPAQLKKDVVDCGSSSGSKSGLQILLIIHYNVQNQHNSNTNFTSFYQ
jgi:hypothetical protein